MIKTEKHSELSELIKNKLDSYINLEFGHIPIVKETEWATPNWTIINYENDQIATFYSIVEREIIIDGHGFTAAGIKNVITPKEFRGKGYASKTLIATENMIFDQLNCQLGVLLCANDLIPFYERLDWYKVDCPVYFEQNNGVNLWGANTMLLTKGEHLRPSRIELNGLPW